MKLPSDRPLGLSVTRLGEAAVARFWKREFPAANQLAIWIQQREMATEPVSADTVEILANILICTNSTQQLLSLLSESIDIPPQGS